MEKWKNIKSSAVVAGSLSPNRDFRSQQDVYQVPGMAKARDTIQMQPGNQSLCIKHSTPFLGIRGIRGVMPQMLCRDLARSCNDFLSRSRCFLKISKGLRLPQAINMRHIKMHYFTSHPDLNKFAVIPRGRDIDYSTPHKRAKLSE